MRVLVTGATGVIGSHLIDHLLDHVGAEVWGLRRWRTPPYRDGEVSYLEGDVTDPTSIASALEEAGADVVFHLAAMSYTRPSYGAPSLTWQVNVVGTVNLLEGIRSASRKPERIVIAGSAAAYGDQEEYPTHESAAFHPTSPYGCTKAAQDHLGHQYFRAYSLPIIRTRSYIHVGTRQGLHNACQAFADQVAKAERGLQDPVIKVGNLGTRRDILDVRDAVKAFWGLAETGKVGEAYNVSRGRAHRIGDLLDELLALSRIRLTVQEDAGRLRPVDTPLEVGVNDKLRAATGWAPEIDLKDTVRWVLDWRREFDRGSGKA